MGICYKKRHYCEQLARPKPKKCKSRVKCTDNWSFYERLYNQPFRVEERLARERAREQQQNRDNIKRLREKKHFYKSLTKFLSIMKNQTINEFSTMTTENFQDNMVKFYGVEQKALILSLDWAKFDVTNKETRSATLKAMCADNPEVSEKLDSIEEQKDKERKEQNKVETEQAKNLKKALEKAQSPEEKLAILAQFGF